MVAGRFETLVAEANAAHFEGWDFSWVKGRIVEGHLPWVYAVRVRRRIPGASSLLDLGTGGGERLAAMQPLPPLTVATEAHGPNVGVAARTLQPLGACVVHVEDGTHNMLGPIPEHPERRLPFLSGSFDLIVSRHSSFAPVEIARLLKPGGRFITQQVAEPTDMELNVFLGGSPKRWETPAELPGLEDFGLRIVEHATASFDATFLDVGAVVYHLRAIPWQLEGFTVERYRDRLEAMHDLMEREGGFRTTRARTYIEAVKPN